MVGGIILNQNGSVAAIMWGDLRFQKRQVGQRVEAFIPLVMETGAIQIDGPEDLHTLALSGDRDLRRVPDSAPGGMQGGVLPEAGFIGEEQRPVFSLGFFLMPG